MADWLSALRLCVWLCDNSSIICYLLSDDFIATTFCPVTLIIVSRLHLGQNRGKFSSTVSGRTLIRVLLLQIGHSTHFSFFKCATSILPMGYVGGFLEILEIFWNSRLMRSSISILFPYVILQSYRRLLLFALLNQYTSCGSLPTFRYATFQSVP